MTLMSTARQPQWTLEEREREERVRAVRSRQDHDHAPEQLLEETLRLSRLIGELRQGLARDVPAR